MNQLKKTLFFSMLMLFSAQLWADEQQSASLEDEITGFTIDQTITRLGHDFARHLSNWRHNANEAGNYVLTVYERPSARWGNLIWVTENHKQVYRRFIQPSNTEIKAIAEQAGGDIHKHIKQLKFNALFADKFDIDGDEF